MKRSILGLVVLVCTVGLTFSTSTSRRNKKDPLTLEGCGYGVHPASGGDRIVGGEAALHGQYPWTVSEVHVHDNFNSHTFENDIALLKLKEPIDIKQAGGYINGICLPKNRDDQKGFSRATGWGHTYRGGVGSDILKQVVLPIVDRDTCNRAYRRYDSETPIFSHMICAGQTGRDTCQADSGGPLFQTDGNGVSTLIGITSFGIGCGNNHPGVYTKIAEFRDWMARIILS